MIRDVNIQEISDGKLYTSSDLARLGCNDCSGCSSCCRSMSETILLDPYDMYLLTKGLQMTFDQLMETHLELLLVDGVILPNLMMDSATDSCNFLNEEGRCSIHPYRPGICRLFPLGRLYENGSFSYFLQKDECEKPHRTKVRISKWLGYDHIARYERFVSDWHYLTRDLGEELLEMQDQAEVRKIQTMLLQLFYRMPYDTGLDFYQQFYARLARIR